MKYIKPEVKICEFASDIVQTSTPTTTEFASFSIPSWETGWGW